MDPDLKKRKADKLRDPPPLPELVAIPSLKRVKSDPVSLQELQQICITFPKHVGEKEKPSETIMEEPEKQEFSEEEYLSDMPIDDAFDFDFEDLKTQLSQINFSSEKIQVRARLLSPMSLHQRFGSQELITIIRTQTYDRIYKFMKSQKLMTKKNHFMKKFVYGKTGIGKSYGFARTVLLLRKAKIPVFYVNNPESFSTDYFVQELRYAVEFSLYPEQKIVYQNEALKKLNLNPNEKDTDLWKILYQMDETVEKIFKAFRRLLILLSKISKSWLIILIDQAPIWHETQHLKRVNIANFIEEIFRDPMEHIWTILCSSHCPPYKSQFYHEESDRYCISGPCFDEKQAEAYISENLDPKIWTLSVGNNQDPTDTEKFKKDVFGIIKETTQNIPSEISVICRISREISLNSGDINSLIDLYINERSKEVRKLIQDFEKRAPKVQENWIRWLAYSYLDMPRRYTNDEEIDQNLCNFVPSKRNPQYSVLEFHPPIYKTIVERHYQREIDEKIKEILPTDV